MVREVDLHLPGAELAVPSAVHGELDALVARGTPHAEAARSFARRLRSVAVEGRGDAAVERAALRLRATVVTADRALADRLRRAGVAVLVPRDRTRLELRLPRAPGGGASRSRRRGPPPKG